MRSSSCHISSFIRDFLKHIIMFKGNNLIKSLLFNYFWRYYMYLKNSTCQNSINYMSFEIQKSIKFEDRIQFGRRIQKFEISGSNMKHFKGSYKQYKIMSIFIYILWTELAYGLASFKIYYARNTLDDFDSTITQSKLKFNI